MHPSLLDAATGADRLTRRQALARVAQLVGGALSTSMLAGLAAGQEPDAVPAAALTVPQRELLAVVVDHVIPETDTPGARAAGVPEFIEVVWSECFSAAERDAFAAGLAELDRRARQAHGRRFLDCAAGQQLAILEDLDRASFRPSEAVPPPPRPAAAVGAPRTDAGEWVWGEPWRQLPPAAPFWRTLKRLTLVGYYTSEVGATRELRYEPVPGRFQGCVPLESVGRAWAV